MIRTKRDSLERFIRTQMEGPGACNNRFDFIDENMNDITDVINTTPGSLYSTAVLFPKRIPNQNTNPCQSEEAIKSNEEGKRREDEIADAPEVKTREDKTKEQNIVQQRRKNGK